MEQLFNHQNYLLKQVSNKFIRQLFHEINWGNRMLAIKGPRGSGKTTLLLQYIKYELKQPVNKALYISLDHYWFYDNILTELVDTFYKNGGKYLFIDEVHKYPNWSRELKNIYDSFPDLKVVFTASSALDIYRGESDLSRRVITYELPGLSFREYLSFLNIYHTEKISFEELLEKHQILSTEITEKNKILYHFKNYLKHGYFPYFKEAAETDYHMKLLQTINAVLESDLSFTHGYSAQTAFKIKKFLSILAYSVPFKPNIAALARKLDVSRDMVYDWFSLLESARLVNLINTKSKGVAYLQKPDKVYLENTNMAYAFLKEPNIGSIRESFFMNQLTNAKLSFTLPKKGDFQIGEKFIFEIGGKQKTKSQLKNIDNAFFALDDIEIGYGNKIPLWLFGFLY
ncbi:MAG: ATP-binding protein [Chitinophagaceae bacterium]|nr:MAG: ATP-binding protein [Chitinophagaceae bacterium]